MATAAFLVWGEDGFLVRETAEAVLGDIDPTEVDADEWTGAELQDLATPSLFGERRALLVNDARSLTKDAVAQIASYLQAPDPDAVLVIACEVAERGKPPAALVKAMEGVGEVRQAQIPRKELEPWLVRRAGEAGIDLTPPAARALVEVMGEEAGPLASSLQQLGSAFPGIKITSKEVHGQFRGLGEQQTWDLCDKAFAKDLPGAMRSLRSIEEMGDDPLKTLGGIALRLRELIKVRALPDRMPPRQVAQEAGLRFDWQARRYQQQARNFSMPELVRLHARITDVDRALKSGATGTVVMPALVSEIAAARG